MFSTVQPHTGTGLRRLGWTVLHQVAWLVTPEGPGEEGAVSGW
jgi:hypothetical protein